MNSEDRHKFKQFLKEHHTYNNFKKQVALWFRYNYNDDPHAFRKYLNKAAAPSVIGGAFSWYSSPEGYDFWFDLFVEWNAQNI